jgi:hypothetical protein
MLVTTTTGWDCFVFTLDTDYAATSLKDLVQADKGDCLVAVPDRADELPTLTATNHGKQYISPYSHRFAHLLNPTHQSSHRLLSFLLRC